MRDDDIYNITRDMYAAVPFNRRMEIFQNWEKVTVIFGKIVERKGIYKKSDILPRELENVREVFKFIASKREVSKSELLRRFRAINVTEMNKILFDLLREQKINEFKIKRIEFGRPKSIYSKIL